MPHVALRVALESLPTEEVGLRPEYDDVWERKTLSLLSIVHVIKLRGLRVIEESVVVDMVATRLNLTLADKVTPLQFVAKCLFNDRTNHDRAALS